MIPKTDKAFFKQNAAALLQTVPFFLLGFGVPLLLVLLHLSNGKWLLYGALVWLAAVAIKSLPALVALFYYPYKTNYNATAAGILEGLWSAATELGSALVFLWYFRNGISVHNVFSFGLGAGFAEVLLILFLLLEDIEKLTDEINQRRGFVLWPQLIERVLAAGLHVFSRALIGFGLFWGKGFLLAFIAFSSFAFIDGWGGYLEKRGRLKDRHSIRRFYWVLLVVVTALGILCFLSLPDRPTRFSAV